MTMMLRITQKNCEMQNTEDKEKQLEAVQEFNELLLPFYASMESLLSQLREAKQNIESLIK